MKKQIQINKITETSALWYRSKLMVYGLLTLLIVIDHFESEENYEECDKILKCIKEQNDYMQLDLPTRMDNEAIKYTQNAYKELKLKGANIYNSHAYYAEILLKEIAEVKNLA